ncbi:MAG: archaeosortase/exosortase family protein [Candidatus Bathyarchaeota archaeon]|nr:archaeosortase/exosortase family protein [Candidatus Bathyarchaeota archaeon]
MRKSWFHIALIICIALPIMMLVFLDYFNMEGYNYRYNGETNAFESWPNTFFNQSFLFELTWKGRMFLLVFLWIILIESVMDWKRFADEKPKNRYIIIASLICALIPTFYVLAINFFGLDLAILKIGHDVFGIRSVSGTNEPWDFLHLHWPISCEYIIFSVFFISAIILAYRTKGLKTLSISLALLGGIGVAYMFDTIYPFGVFRPLQAFALPTAAVAAGILDLLGYTVMLVFPTYTAESALPALTVNAGSNSASALIAWACAGVQSLLLYTLIILVFFKKSDISSFRKLAYFVIGLFGTFFVNVFRVISILIIMLNYGNEAGMVFHNTYGEIYSVIWILLYILLVGCIQRFMLVERTRDAFHRFSALLRTAKNKLSSRLKTEKGKLSS